MATLGQALERIPMLDNNHRIQAGAKAFFMPLERPILPTDLAPLPYDEALDVLLNFTHHSKETSNVAND